MMKLEGIDDFPQLKLELTEEGKQIFQAAAIKYAIYNEQPEKIGFRRLENGRTRTKLTYSNCFISFTAECQSMNINDRHPDEPTYEFAYSNIADIEIVGRSKTSSVIPASSSSADGPFHQR